MSKPFGSFLSRCVRLYPRLTFRAASRTECRVRAYCSGTRTRRLLSKSVSILLFACMSVILMGNDSCNVAKTAEEEHALRVLISLGGTGKGPVFGGVSKPHATAPELTGTDGSQTGTASFEGNFTTITEPSQGLFLLARLKDCSLDLITVNSDSDPGTATPHYEQTLHQLASLKTTADVFPHGCVDTNTGISSRPEVGVGGTTGKVLVFAGVDATGLFVFNSNNSLTEIREISVPNASAVITADVNGDGNGDLVVVNGSGAPSADVSVMLGNADGTFQNPVNYPIAGNYSTAAVIDDVNGDGKLDIVAVSADQQISVLLGKGDGTFQSAQSFAAPVLPGYTSAASTPIVNLITADVNGDGKKDVICSNGLVLLGKGDGTFTAAAKPAFPYTAGSSSEGPNLASGDLNNDGKLDLALNTGTAISTWIGKGDGTFTQGSGYASINDTGFVTVTDLDGDGNADIYVGLANGGLFSGDDSDPNSAYVLMGNGDGTFQGAPALSSGAYSGNNLADLNGDGVPDLVYNTFASVSGTSAAFTVALSDGKGTFTPVSTITAPDTFTINGYKFTGVSKLGATSYAVADVNGDDKADLVFVDNGLTAINPGSGFPITYTYPVYFVALGNGDGTFQAPVPHAFPQIAPPADFDNSLTVAGLEIADFNRDGHADLIFNYNDIAGGTGATPYLQGLGVLTGKGDGTFASTPILTSTYSSTTAPAVALVPQIVNVADLNGDSNPDLIVNVVSGTIVNFQAPTQLQVFLSNGDGTFKPPTTVPIGVDAYATALADFNKDGKPDLAALTENSAGQAALAISLGKGDGTFAATVIANIAGGDAIRSSELAAADFDDDGNIDLALFDANDFSGIFYGKGDGTFTSVPLNGNIVPKDLINVVGGGGLAVAVDLNKDGKPDILAGSVSLLNIYGSAPVVTGPAATATTLTASAATIAAGSSVTFTAHVTPTGSGTPTGTVTFLNGATSLGTGTLNSGGQATFSTSSLAAGSYSVTAAYGGDGTFAASTSPAVVLTVTGAGVGSDFTLAASVGKLTIASGKSGTDTISVTPMNGFNQATSFACSGLPAAAGCSFSPASVTPNGAAASSTMTITTAAASGRNVSTWPFAGGGVAFAIGLFFVRGRKHLQNVLGLVLLLLGIGGMASGCGGSSSTKSSGTPAGTSTVTITATSGTGTTALSHTTTLSLTIQ
jgi:hypothetical protein